MKRFSDLACSRTLHILGFVAVVLFGNLLLAPVAQAATVLSGQTLSVSTSTPDNTYVFAGQARITTSLPQDLSAAAGTLTVAGTVGGDALLAGGTVDVQKPVTGDVRIVGGRVLDDDTVGGDLMIAGGAVTVAGKAKNTHIVGGNVEMLNGSNGPVTVYGADVSLAGEYNGDVEVVASDKITIQDGTIIHGVLKYNAPQQADLPTTAHVDGSVNYIGSASWLPTAKQAKTFATASVWILILVRLTAALVAVGLIAGLFPIFADRIIEATIRKNPESFILLTLLGFAGFIAIPVLIVFLSVSFVGIGIALILLTSYALFLLLSYVYASIIAGAGIMYLIRKRTKISWRVAILGVIVLYIVGLIPYVGVMLKVILCATAGGAMLSLFYRFAFKREKIDLLSL